MDANKNRSSKSSFNASSSRGPGFCQRLCLSVMILTAKPLVFEGWRAASRAPTGRGTMRAGHRHNHGTAGQRSQPAPTPDFQSATRTISMHHPVRRPVSTPWRSYRDHTEFAEISPQSLPHGRIEYEIWPPRLKGRQASACPHFPPFAVQNSPTDGIGPRHVGCSRPALGPWFVPRG